MNETIWTRLRKEASHRDAESPEPDAYCISRGGDGLRAAAAHGEALEGEVTALRAALVRHEWVWLQNDIRARCLECRNLREWGHKAGCISAVLARAAAEKGSEG